MKTLNKIFLFLCCYAIVLISFSECNQKPAKSIGKLPESPGSNDKLVAGFQHQLTRRKNDSARIFREEKEALVNKLEKQKKDIDKGIFELKNEIKKAEAGARKTIIEENKIMVSWSRELGEKINMAKKAGQQNWKKLRDEMKTAGDNIEKKWTETKLNIEKHFMGGTG